MWSTVRALLLALLMVSTRSCTARQTTLPPFRGVNIGGWLVLESWITPDLFARNNVSKGQGEWQFCQQLGSDKCKEQLEQHWSSWVSKDDLTKLAASGINWLRVPVGYWIVDRQVGEPWVEGGLAHLQELLTWAGELELKVLVDLHGAPGSQNGHDNSGKTGPIQWNSPSNINRTIKDLGLLAQAVAAYPAAQAIELLNEPWTTAVGGPIEFTTLKSFYEAAYAHLRSSEIGFQGLVFMSDGFDNDQWNHFMPPTAYEDVYLSVHLYHCFGGARAQPTSYQNVEYTCTHDAPMLAGFTQRDWSVVTEFSLCLPTGITPAGGNATAPALQKFNWVFNAAQVAAYGSGGSAPAQGPAKGSFFWNFKIAPESPIESSWDYLEGLHYGWMPQTLSDWSLPGCSLWWGQR